MRKHKKLTRPVAVAAVSVMAAGVAAISATPAMAIAPGVAGYLTPSPATGTNTTAMVLNTSDACPSGTNIIVKVFGNGFPAGGQIVVGNSATSSYSTNANGGYVVPLGQTMQDYANLQSPPASLSGAYQFVLTCRTATNATSLGDFTTKIFFTSPTAYQVAGPAAVGSATALSVADDGTNPQTLTATVTPASGTTVPTGWVEFYDGANRIAASATSGLVALDGTGHASLALPTRFTLPAHQVHAVYTPDDTAAFGGSTSPNQSVPVVQTPTNTSLAVSPAGHQTVFQNVTLTATVDQPAAGTVAFQDTATSPATTLATQAVTVGATNATAQLITSFSSAGTHTFQAVFTPTSSANWSSSTSAPTSYTIDAASTAPVTEQIAVTVAPGALTLSIDNNPVVVMHGPSCSAAPSPSCAADLNANGDLFVAVGSLNPITVTDTRTQDQGPTHWTVSGSVVDFSDGSGHGISGNNLGWTPQVIDHATTQTVTAGGAVTPAHGVAAGTSADPSLGLLASRTLAASQTGTPTGTAHVGAALDLNIPTNTPPNTAGHVYSTTMTITAA